MPPNNAPGVYCMEQALLVGPKGLETILMGYLNAGLGDIEEHQRCLRLDSYFMVVVLAATSYSRGCFSLCLDGSARRVTVPGGSTFHL